MIKKVYSLSIISFLISSLALAYVYSNQAAQETGNSEVNLFIMAVNVISATFICLYLAVFLINLVSKNGKPKNTQ